MSVYATRNGGRRCAPRPPAFMLLVVAMLPALGQAQTVNICDRTEAVRFAIVRAAGASDCAEVSAAQMDGIEELELQGRGIASLRAGDFAGLGGLEDLELNDNQLTSLPVGVFRGLRNLEDIDLSENQLTDLPAGVFDGLNLGGWTGLSLANNQLQSLRPGVFNGLDVSYLDLSGNQLKSLQTGVFDGLDVSYLRLNENHLETLPASIFDGLPGVWDLHLENNHLESLPAGAFAGLRMEGWFDSGGNIHLSGNQLETLPLGVFSGLSGLGELYLNDNRLTVLPTGVFSGLSDLTRLDLSNNHLVGLDRTDALFAVLPPGVTLILGGQTPPPSRPTQPETRLAAAVPLMLSASESTRQGFVRIINESEESGRVRIFAFDDSGTAADPIDIRLDANQAIHFNAGDLENGNAGKGINAGVGSPIQGDWRLDVETALDVRVLSFVRTTDGFLTAMGDVLPRDADGRLAAQTFNPGSNSNQVSKLRLVNTGANAERVSIEGVDDQGDRAGPVTLTLAAGESRTFSASDLENGAQGLAGTLGDGAGKWRLFITAVQAVEGMSLLEAVTGHLTNISTMGIAAEGQ